MAADTLTPPDFEAIKARQQAAWATGDFAVVGAALVIMPELLCEAMDIRSGWRVLDVAGGSGNASLAAARRGCRVTSTDFVPELLERGKLRAAAEGLRMDFLVADAENLPFSDAEFDAVISTVGVMFAPQQERAAAELLRVVKPGGKIGLACWTPGGYIGQSFQLMARYVPPPPGLKPSSLWGTEPRQRELFAGAANIDVATRIFTMRSLSPAFWIEHMKIYFGPFNRTFAALDPAGQDAMTNELLALIAAHNRAGDGTMVVPSEYLETVITR